MIDLRDRFRQMRYAWEDWRARVAPRVRLAPRLSPKALRSGLLVGGALVLIAAAAAILTLRPVRRPDYMYGELDAIFDYTLLESAFNDLPVRERLELIGRLVRRIDQMDQSESAVVAAFAAGIAGSAREQLEENVAMLFIDLFDQYATEYDDVPREQRERALDQAIIDLDRTFYAMGNDRDARTDAEILASAREQARRDYERLRDSDRRPSNRAWSAMFGFMTDNVGSHGTPQQRARISLLMRDMVRHLRGQDIRTGRGPG